MDNTDGSVVIGVNMNTKQADKEIAKLTSNIEKTEQEIDKTSRKRQEAQQKSLFQAGELDQEKAKLQEIQDRLSDIRSMSKDKGVPLETRESIKAQIPIVQQELSDQKTRVSMLQAEWNKTENSVDRYNQKIADATEKLNRQKNEAGELTHHIESAKRASSGMGSAIGYAGEKMDKFFSRVKKLATRVFVFTVITSALRSLRTWLSNTVKSNDEAQKSISKLKGAMLTLAQPLVNVIIPSFTKLVNILAKVAAMAANIVSKLSGKTVEESAAAAKNLYEEQKAIEGVQDAAEDAAGSLAGFDEINKASSQTSDIGASTDETAPDFSGLIDTKLGEMEAIVGGALLAIGALLAFSGVNIPLGITLMAIGALTLSAVAKENPDAIILSLQGQIGAIAAILSVAFLAIGAIIAFSGANIPLGIALMIVGASVLATTVAVNWDTIQNTLQGPIGKVVAIVSIALLALGAILVFCGAAIPLGIGLMIAGAVGLAATVAVNWNAIVQALQGPIGMIVGIVSASLLVIGVILLFTGAGIPLGLGLIAAGAAGLAVAIAPNWNALSEKIKGVWDSIKRWWNTYVAKYFTADYWKQLGKDMINGLIGSFEKGLNNILSGAGSFVNSIIGVLNNIPGVSINSVSWGNVKLPRLANGAVIPPNHEFAAILGDQKHGTNIEAPLATIQEAVATVMEDYSMANLAGHEATVEVLREILQAVLGIEIGDDIIGRANERYQQKMNTARGGA